jgi:hypothetical protein
MAHFGYGSLAIKEASCGMQGYDCQVQNSPWLKKAVSM